LTPVAQAAAGVVPSAAGLPWVEVTRTLFSVPDQTPLDLAKLDAWFGVRPGMARAQVLAALQQQGVEAEAYGEDNLTATTDEWEMEFHFAKDGSERLRQLSIDGEEILWAGRPLMGARVDDALRTLEPRGAAMWEANDSIGDPFPAPDGGPRRPVPDEELLEESTIWLPERGLGLVICDGEVFGVAWRATQDLPAQFDGPVTEVQRELSRRPDLEDYLRDKRTERNRIATPKDPVAPLRTTLTVLTLAALAAVGRLGIMEGQLWKQAPTLTAKLVAIEQVPMKQFREYVPPALRWVVPPSRPVIVEGYRVEFLDPHGQRQEVVLERGELYVPPRETGEEVPVAYVDGDPPRVKGLSRARDSEFLEYMPWAIAIGAVYLIVQFVLGLLPRALRLLRPWLSRLVRTGGIKDPDRPELS
jgi:hypothetical protein